MLTAVAMPAACTGLWISTERADYIFYERDTTPSHQLRIILHEIGHMLLGHEGVPFAGRAITLLFPHLDPDMVAASFAQSASNIVYSQTEEVGADIFAALFLEIIQDTR